MVETKMVTSMLHKELYERAQKVKLSNLDLSCKLGVSDRTIYNLFYGKAERTDRLRDRCFVLCVEQAIRHRKWQIKNNLYNGKRDYRKNNKAD
jgi:hypothetical protein